MKNILQVLKNLIAFAVLCISPMCIFSVIEYAITSDVSRTFEYIAIVTLIGAVLSVAVFSSQKAVSISIGKPKIRFMISILGIGITSKQCILYLLGLTIGVNVTGSFDTSFFSLLSILLLSPFSEEIIFRGVLTDLLNPQKSKSKICFIVVVLISSLIWTAAHLHGASVASLLLFIDGVIMTAIYLKYRNLVLTILYHSALNASMLMVGILNETHYGIAMGICAAILLASIWNLIHMKNASAADLECNTNI